MLKTVGNEEIANAKGYGRGLTGVGKVVYRTAQLYSTNSTAGRLAFLKDIVGFSDWQVDNSGNYSYTHLYYCLGNSTP